MTLRRNPIVGFGLAMSLGLAGGALAQGAEAVADRFAIVIGNSDYDVIPDLRNAVTDATSVADLFRDVGYFVSLHHDVDKRDFERILQQVLFEVQPEDEVVLYFAGHGFQVGTENYLLPVDANFDSAVDLPFEAVSLGSLVDLLGSRARLQIFILDSCRDNPFAGLPTLYEVGNDLREVRTGFATQAAPVNSLLIFSTAPGSVAYDGLGTNSPFTGAFVEVVRAQPEAAVERVVQDVRQRVYTSTDGRQVPWDSSTLLEPTSFGLGLTGADGTPGAVQDGSLGLDRGLVLAELGTPASPPSPETEALATITAEFAPVVALGPALREALGLAGETVTVVLAPEVGELALSAGPGAGRIAAGDVIEPADVDRLILRNGATQIPALTLEGGLVRDSLSVLVDGTTVAVDLVMRPDPCDLEAGDRLDPDGMGLTRYPNEIRPEVALAACQEAVARAPEVGRFHHQLGRALVALRRHDEARAAFETARDLGHARAWNALGGMLLNAERERSGLGEAVASPEVLELFAQGVARGDPYAAFSLGFQLLNYGETDARQIEGYDLMMRALEVGHTFPMNALGEFYLTEGSEHYNAERGLRYFEESAARGDIYGYNNLGLAYLLGEGGLEIDAALAFDLFLRAADGGHPSAPFNVARMYEEGTAPGGRDLEKAVTWFAEGLERGDALAAANAAYFIVTEDVPGYDRFDAAMIAAKGAALGETPNAAEARAQLEAMATDAMDGGAQKLIVALGGDVVVDGDFGSASVAEMQRILDRFGEGEAETDPLLRVIQLARIYWRTSPFRVDLY